MYWESWETTLSEVALGWARVILWFPGALKSGGLSGAGWEGHLLALCTCVQRVHTGHMAWSVELEAPIYEAPGPSPGLRAPAPAPPPSSLCAPCLATSCPYTSRPHPIPALATVIVNRDLSNVSGVTVQETVVFVVVVLI